MLRSSKKWLSVLLILGLSRDCHGRKPVISPAKSEIYIDEGDSLELSCMSAKRMKFYYPKERGNEFKQYETSPVRLKEQSLRDKQKITFRRFETVHDDTGWYGCADYDIKVTPRVYDQPEVSWTYVYVRSNTSYFVQRELLVSQEVVTGTVTVHCRPTSPHYKVVLITDGKETQMGGNISYDPRFGFQLKNITMEDIAYIQCLIQEGDTIQKRNFHMFTGWNHVLIDSEIDKDNLRRVRRDQIFYVSCTIDVDADIPYNFSWTTPQQSSRLTSSLYNATIELNKQQITSILVIEGVTYEDDGIYDCTLTTFSAVKKKTMYIMVYDPNINYLKLTSPYNSSVFKGNQNEYITWHVFVNGNPQPELRWLNPSGKEIINTRIEPESLKYDVGITSLTTTLKINSLDFADIGTYALKATNEAGVSTITFDLEVIAKPMVIFSELNAFFLPKQKVETACQIISCPAPNVTWTFLKIPYYASIEGSEIVELKHYSIPEVPRVPQNVALLNSVVTNSVVTMTIETSGHLTCTACNTLGCHSATKSVVVSDVPDGFAILKMAEAETDLVEGDDVEVTCAAAVDYYDRVEWVNNMDNAVTETDRISITKSSTNYSFRSTLRIKNIRKSDNSSYTCKATHLAHNLKSSRRRRIYKPLIYDPIAPIISETNMNKTTVTLDLSTESHNTVTLKCHVQGVPKPNVTWYKDDTRINANKQYEYRYDYQELYIQYLLAENSGKYTCKAKNRFGTAENYQTILLNVKEVSTVWIIPIVVFLLICAKFVIYFSIKTHRENVIRMQLKELGLTHFEEGALQSLNPNLTVGDQAELLPYDKKWEFPRERLQFGKQLGFGAFGVVMKADALGICKHEAVSTVAVKTVRKSSGSTQIRALASELKIMVHLGKHLNVVNLLGACTKNIIKRELLVIFEYCRFGNLHNYLLKGRANFINQICPATLKLGPAIGLDSRTGVTSVGSNNGLSANSSHSNPGAVLSSYTIGTDSEDISMSPDGCVLNKNSTLSVWRSNSRGDYKDQNFKPICTQDLLSWGFQVARGMEYLSQRRVLHGDLAARNVLLAENNIVKICDFGLAKTMYNYENYKKKGDAPLPIKWMAVESIRDQVFSTQSDIWSFGVVLWEFFTLAKTPYPGMEPVKQYKKLIEGYRLERPEYATNEVYDIMLQCWKEKPTLRPTFTNLVSSIGNLLEESVKTHYLDLNAPYMDMNAMVLESGKSDYLTMMSAPDHHFLVSTNNEYVNSSSLSPPIHQDDSYIPMNPSIHGGDLGIFRPTVTLNCDKINFSTSNGKSTVHSGSETEIVDLPTTLNHDDENYLKLISVQER